MYFLIGLGISFISIVWSIIHLRQSATNYLDPVGIAVVIGGTLAVGVMILPWSMIPELKDAIRRLFGNRKIDFKLLNHECLELVRSLHAGSLDYTAKEKTIAYQTLADGVELIGLGFTTEKIHLILDERIHQWMERKQKVSGAIRSLAKYPPAFGLVGTVLGLVSLMRAISEGASSTEAGFRMAVALVATLYGLLLANLVLNPAGEFIAKHSAEERKAADLSMEAILLAADRVTLLEVQEMLNSKVAPSERVNIMGNLGSSDESAPEAEAAA